MAAEDYAEAVELIETNWISYANMWRYDTVLAWIRQLPEATLTNEVHLLLVQAWALSLSARKTEATRAIAVIERQGDLTAGPLRDGFGSAEASLTMLRAAFPWGDVGVELNNGRRVAELEGRGSPWRPLVCWAVGMGLYFKGERDESDEWFAEAVALAPASAQWLAGTSSLAFRSLIAGERGCVDEQCTLAESRSPIRTRAWHGARRRHSAAGGGAVPGGTRQTVEARCP